MRSNVAVLSLTLAMLSLTTPCTLANSAVSKDTLVSNGKLYVIMVLDVEDVNIGKSVERDEIAFMDLINGGKLGNRLESPIVLKRGTFSAASLRKAISSVGNRISSNDTVIFYFSGHGSTTKDGYYHYLKMGNHAHDRVLRWHVQRSLRATKARLVVMLTDCCASSGARAVPLYSKEGLPELFDTLFFTYKGIISWNACSIHEYAIGDVFTPAFIETCAQVASDNPKAAKWEDLMNQVADKTQQRNSAQKPADFLVCECGCGKLNSHCKAQYCPLGKLGVRGGPLNKVPPCPPTPSPLENAFYKW